MTSGSKTFGAFTVAGILASIGCTDCQQDCQVTTADDLRALSASGFQCDILDISETELATLDGAEGIRDAFNVYIASNPNLVDVSAIQDFSTVNFSLVFNPALENVVLGPIGGGGIAVSNNAVETAHLKLTGNVELVFVEPALRELRLDGTPESIDLSFKDGIPAEAAWDPVALNVETLRVRNVPSATTAATFEPLGIARDLIGIYGCGLQPGSAEVDLLNDALRADGFGGTLEVCPHECDADPAVPSCPDDRPSTERRAGCVTREE